MEQYTPAIHEAFRRRGFPIERAGKVRQVTFGPSATALVEMVERQRWEYHNREEMWSVLVTEDSVILQTTAHTPVQGIRRAAAVCRQHGAGRVRT